LGEEVVGTGGGIKTGRHKGPDLQGKGKSLMS